MSRLISETKPLIKAFSERICPAFRLRPGASRAKPRFKRWRKGVEFDDIANLRKIPGRQ